jgi:hypothetical protein
MDASSAARRALGHPAATVARAAWVVLPFLLGPALDDALAGASAPVRVVTAVGLWAGWGAGLVALLIRRPVTLTVVRVLAPCAVVLGVLCALTDGVGVVLAAAALAVATVASVAVLLPTFGDRWVDGASYGDERRFLLRPPAPVLLVAPVAWAVLVVAATAGPLLLAVRQWVAGALLTVLGAVVAVMAARALHGLSERWAVLVPTGLVLRDPMTVTDPFLCLRAETAALGPAHRGERLDAEGHADLTAGAPGLVLTLALRSEVAITRRQRRRAAAIEPASRIHFVPSRPGALLAEAAGRRFPVRA